MKAPDQRVINFQTENGQEVEPEAVVFQLEPPADAFRGRADAFLTAYLMLNGNSADPANSVEHIKNLLVTGFYNFAGPLTSALKNAVEQINTMLMDANLRTTSKGQYRFGCIVLVCHHQNKLTIVQSGPVRAYLIGSPIKEYYDPNLAGKGLGISPTPKMYFSQTPVTIGDSLLVSLEQPESWHSVLMNMSAGKTPEEIKQSLVGAARQSAAGMLLHYPTTVFQPSPVETNHSNGATVLDRSVRQNEGGRNSPKQPPLISDGSRRQARRSRHAQSAPNFTGLVLWLLNGIRVIRQATTKLAITIESNLFHILPEDDLHPSIQSGSQRAGQITAILLPVSVLILAQLVYSNIGFDARYSEYLELARSNVIAAGASSDINVKKTEMSSAINWINKAEKSAGQLDPEADSLRRLVMTELDGFDKIIRLSYVPILSQPLNLPTAINRMRASKTDLFLLDSVDNKILRFVNNGQRFDQDNGFTCEGGTVSDGQGGTIEMGRLIDMVPVSRALHNPAVVIAIDENAHLLYCSPSGRPVGAALKIPDLGIKQVGGLAIYERMLFILDPIGNAIWYYFSDDEWQFSDAPSFPFGAEIPGGMENATGLAVGSDSLTILFSDGHLSICAFSGATGTATNCQERTALPAVASDGADSGEMKLAVYTAVQITEQPNMALLLLDSSNREVTMFSPRSFDLQSRFKSLAGASDPFPKTAVVRLMAISPNKAIFLMEGDQIYTATLQ